MPDGGIGSTALSRRSSLDLARLAETLKQLHRLPRPHTVELTELDPFAELAPGIAAARTFDAADRRWLHEHLAQLQGRWLGWPTESPPSVICGRANIDDLIIASDDEGAVSIDLGLAVLGPQEWDLVPTAMDVWSFGWSTTTEYAHFCRTYGRDVMRTDRYYLLRDIHEFTMVIAVAEAAATDRRLHGQAAHRLACIRGDIGMRPWPDWQPLEQIGSPGPTAQLPSRVSTMIRPHQQNGATEDAVRSCTW